MKVDMHELLMDIAPSMEIGELDYSGSDYIVREFLFEKTGRTIPMELIGFYEDTAIYMHENEIGWASLRIPTPEKPDEVLVEICVDSVEDEDLRREFKLDQCTRIIPTYRITRKDIMEW